MEKIIDFLRNLSEEKDFYFYLNEETKEIWVSGYNNSVKFDLLVRPIKKVYIKVIYETPFRRVPILFLDEEKALKRLQTIFKSLENKEDVSKTQKMEGENIFGFSGYSIERAKNN